MGRVFEPISRLEHQRKELFVVELRLVEEGQRLWRKVNVSEEKSTFVKKGQRL